MKWTAPIICFLIASVFSGCGQTPVESSPAGNFATARREVFEFNKDPALAAVGKISFIGGRWCSLTLVAEDVGVTAGHCFLKSNLKFDLTKDLDPYSTSVIFKPDGQRRIENISIKRVLAARLEPDYAIVRLSRKIPPETIRPLKILNSTVDEIRSGKARFGCAGFNGDEALGSGGMLLTISRDVKVIPESSSPERIDANCFSTYGGSGGLFFEERNGSEANAGEVVLIGVIWGMTDEKYDEKGTLVKDENVVTSITPAGVFYDELNQMIKAK